MSGTVLFQRLENVTNAQDRVYPLILPQSPVYPAIVYQQVSTVRTHAMGQDSPTVRVRAQVSLYAATYAEARVLAAQVAARLSRFRGDVDTVRVLDVLFDGELEGYESETNTRRVTQEYTLFLTSAS